MNEIVNLTITQKAAAELSRQASFGGTPGSMYIDLVDDAKDEGWLHIRLNPGKCGGLPISRNEGITLYTKNKNFELLKGLVLDYYSDLSGGGFLISNPSSSIRCSCGSGFKLM